MPWLKSNIIDYLLGSGPAAKSTKKIKRQTKSTKKKAVASPASGLVPSLKEVVVEVRREKVPLTSLPSPIETILVSSSSSTEDEDLDIRISYSSPAAQDAPAAPDVVMLESSSDDDVVIIMEEPGLGKGVDGPSSEK